jgi:hypothetical protein
MPVRLPSVSANEVIKMLLLGAQREELDHLLACSRCERVVSLWMQRNGFVLGSELGAIALTYAYGPPLAQFGRVREILSAQAPARWFAFRVISGSAYDPPGHVAGGELRWEPCR